MQIRDFPDYEYHKNYRTGKVLAERLGQFVVSTTNKIAARIAS